MGELSPNQNWFISRRYQVQVKLQKLVCLQCIYCSVESFFRITFIVKQEHEGIRNPLQETKKHNILKLTICQKRAFLGILSNQSSILISQPLSHFKEFLKPILKNF